MMKKMSFVLIASLIGLLVLSACGGSDEPAVGSENQAPTGGQEQASTGSDAPASAPEKVRLSDDYTGALSTQVQLSLGTLQLEESDLAIDETAAAELLPLWQALQNLSNSQTAAEIEIEAVVNQIQDSMTAEQVAAIAAMKLTQESLTTMMEEGDFTFGRGAFGAGRGQGEESGFPADGPPGGGLPGGGRGQGGGLGGGPGGGLGDLSEGDRATRRAEFAEGDFGEIQDRLLAGAVVRLLQEKSGQAPERVNVYDTVFTIISEETGLSMEEIQTQTADGAPLAELVEANGGNLEAVRAALIEAFNELPNAEDLDAEQMAAEWLGQ